MAARAACDKFSTTGKSIRFYGILSSHSMKNIRLYRSSKWEHNPPCPEPTEGRFAIVTTRRAQDAMDAVASGGLIPAGRKRCSGRRSRVVPTPRPWRQVGGRYPAGDGGKKRRSPGRARISRKTIARGRSGCLGCTCSSKTRVLCFALFAHGSTGAVGARPSLPPLLKREQKNSQNSGKNLPRECSRLLENCINKIGCRPGLRRDDTEYAVEFTASAASLASPLIALRCIMPNLLCSSPENPDARLSDLHHRPRFHPVPRRLRHI
jgi:hypothetical protein